MAAFRIYAAENNFWFDAHADSEYDDYSQIRAVQGLSAVFTVLANGINTVKKSVSIKTLCVC